MKILENFPADSNSKEEGAINPDGTHGPDWDMLTVESDASFYATVAKEVEYSFAKRLGELDKTKSFMKREEFEKWEDELSDAYARSEIRMYNEGKNLEEVTEVMQNAVAYPGKGREKELRTTIEAQAGNFFPMRRRALERAIDDSDKSSEDKKKAHDKIAEFAEAVYRHMSYKNKDQEDVHDMGYSTYETQRTAIHNRTIKCLNELNHLAKSYHVRPFTMRSFCPSDVREERNQTNAERLIMRYDRDIVEEYYALAFPRDAEKSERDWRDYEKYGILGRD